MMLFWANPLWKKQSRKTDFADLDLVPADQNLVATNLDLVDQEQRESRLQKALASVRDTDTT